MKKLLSILLLALSTNGYAAKAPQGVTYDAQILRVNDGDTIVISAPFLPAPLKQELAVQNAHRRMSEESWLRNLQQMQLPNHLNVKWFYMTGTSSVVVYWEISF
jgi:hypothetical protein